MKPSRTIWKASSLWNSMFRLYCNFTYLLFTKLFTPFTGSSVNCCKLLYTVIKVNGWRLIPNALDVLYTDSRKKKNRPTWDSNPESSANVVPETDALTIRPAGHIDRVLVNIYRRKENPPSTGCYIACIAMWRVAVQSTRVPMS